MKKDGCNHGYKYINVTEGENSFFSDVLLLSLYRSTHFISWGARRSFISVFRVMRIFSDPPHIDTPLHSVSKTHFLVQKVNFFAKLAKWSFLIFVPKIAEKLNSIAEKLYNFAEKMKKLLRKCIILLRK